MTRVKKKDTQKIKVDPLCVAGERGYHTANMERWLVYTVTLQIVAAIARAAEDFRHISYEGKETFLRIHYIVLFFADGE